MSATVFCEKCEMNVYATRVEHHRTWCNPTLGETLDLVKAAKCVVALSGWGTPAGAPTDCKAFMSSYFAVEVLRKAIEQHENPVLRLAPEGIEPGRV